MKIDGHRVYITETYHHIFWQKFRESNVFTKEITKGLICRNIFLVRPNFLFFHTVLCAHLSSIHGKSNFKIFYFRVLIWRNFCKKIVGERFETRYHITITLSKKVSWKIKTYVYTVQVNSKVQIGTNSRKIRFFFFKCVWSGFWFTGSFHGKMIALLFSNSVKREEAYSHKEKFSSVSRKWVEFKNKMIWRKILEKSLFFKV